ncbi:helix-turn-helix domain-containing protein [Actinoplanes sp. NPDC051861]|uniref:helix-turn-helix domain-containing protein n=1 Tax=Actinoplanes sp. NPDC051861 TaxID=3155170 RepID=UPI00341C165D
MSAKRPAPFKVQWERALMRRSKLPLPGIAVLAALASYANADGGSIHPSQARLADDLGVTVRTVGKWVRKGLETGWILEIRRGIGYGDVSMPSVYSLTIPGPLEQSHESSLCSAGQQNQQPPSGSSDDLREEKKEASDSTVDGIRNGKDPSASVWDLAQKRSVREPEAERSHGATGPSVHDNRNEASTYQLNTNSSSTQVTSQPADEAATPEREADISESASYGYPYESFARRFERRAAARAAATEGEPARYRPSWTR